MSKFEVIKKSSELVENKNSNIENLFFFLNFVNLLIPFNKEEQKELTQLIKNDFKNLDDLSVSIDKIFKGDFDEMWSEGKSADDYMASGLRKGNQKGLQKGIQEGKKEGIQEARKESILKLHKKGYTPKQITDLLDYKLNMVKKIIASSKA